MQLPPGIFELKTVADLFGKLQREHALLLKNPANSDICFNFLVTAEHMPDWYLQATGNMKKFRAPHAVLRVCSQLANGAKHFTVKDESLHLLNATAVHDAQTFNSPAPKPAPPATPTVRHFTMDLGPDEAKDLGTKAISIEDLSTKIVEFWRKQLGL